jgi:hypothetical protein
VFNCPGSLRRRFSHDFFQNHPQRQVHTF